MAAERSNADWIARVRHAKAKAASFAEVAKRAGSEMSPDTVNHLARVLMGYADDVAAGLHLPDPQPAVDVAGES